MNKPYEYGDCSYCGGHVAERSIQKICSRKGRLIAVVENVPAGVCEQCGERYYRSDVLKQLDTQLSDMNMSRRQISIPLMNYAA